MKRNAKLFALLALATVVACDVETPQRGRRFGSDDARTSW